MTLSKSAVAALLLAALIFAGTAYALVGAARARGTDNAYVRGDVTPVSTRVSASSPKFWSRTIRRCWRAKSCSASTTATMAPGSTGRGRRLPRGGPRSSGLSVAWPCNGPPSARRKLPRSVGAEAERSGRELARIEVLRRDGWVTKARGDEALAASEKALAGESGAEAALAASHDQYEVIASQRVQFLADIEAAQAELRLAQLDLESTVIRAPSDGRVAERQARKGQFVKPGTPLIALVSRDVWIVANFKETELREMELGEPVSVIVDSQPGRVFAGRVESLSPASGAQFALLPPDNATGNFTRIVQRIPIRITVPAGQPGFAELRPGMSARVRRGEARAS